MTISFVLIIATALACLCLVPVGKFIRVTVLTTPGTVGINGCSLREVYLLNFNNPESLESVGDRLLVLRVSSNQAELFTIEKANITSYLGSYFFDTPTLPAALNVNSELRVTVQLVDSMGTLVAEDETTILYK